MTLFYFQQFPLELTKAFSYNNTWKQKVKLIMKKVLIYYCLTLLVCIVFGLICALISLFSWWYIFLLIFPISLGWLPFAMMMESIPSDKIERVSGIVLIGFIIMIILVILGTLFIHDNTFWGQTSAVSLFASILSHIVLISKIRNKIV